MDSTTLKNNTKEELIKIIADLREKYLIGVANAKKLNIDYSTLLEATSDIIFVIDKDGNLVYVNSAWKQFFPSWTDVAIGDHYSKSIPSIERERAAFVFTEVIRKGKSLSNEMMKMYNDKNQKLYMTLSISPIKDEGGEIAGLVGIMKNITDKHLAEKKAKEYSRILEIKVKEDRKSVV
jgi:PAS domain S-box-containing protein